MKLARASAMLWARGARPTRSTSLSELRIKLRLCEAWVLPASKAAMESGPGSAMKSRIPFRMAARPALKSALASASAVARRTLRRARSTSASPALKVRPLARNPTTGMIAMAMIRLRTDTCELSDLWLRRRDIEMGIAAAGRCARRDRLPARCPAPSLVVTIVSKRLTNSVLAPRRCAPGRGLGSYAIRVPRRAGAGGPHAAGIRPPRNRPRVPRP